MGIGNGSTLITTGVVFLAGMASFFSPCVLPIVPAYLSLISGLSFEELSQKDSLAGARWRLFGSALSFITGFSAVFILIFGGLVALFGELGPWRMWLRDIFGVVAIIFALHMLGVFRINAFYRERRFHISGNRLGIAGAFLIGAAFAFGWTPCIGPILTSVLALAAGTQKVSLLIVYSLGLAIPFLFAALFVHLFLRSLRKVTKYLRAVEIFSGSLLLVMGLLLVTDNLGLLANLLMRFSK